ncbi:MAG: serine/threonine protein kinase [Myxococcales bacterium]|nr:serine/threonine protein kinase [Myxococcales bacterium]
MIGLDRTQFPGDTPTLMASGAEATLVGELSGPSRGAGGSSRPLTRGSSIGRYTVLQMLGAGGMGVVYAAYDPELDRKVAIKLLHAELAPAGASAGATRLLREAQAMARLSHPNVIAVHDVGTHDGQVFMAMEFVEGRTLGGELAARPRGWRDIVALFAAAGRGLAAAHRSGLVHRDFKPDNVMIDRDGRVRVLDFGLACSRNDAPLPELAAAATSSLDIRLTATGAVMGTPAYMAPEQHLGLPADERCDQFAFCVALHESLYGERPFAGDSLPEVVSAVTRGEVRPARAGSRVPGFVRRALLRGLAVAPEDRWPDMTALLAALERDPARRRRAGLAIAAAALAIAGGVFAIQQQVDARARLCTGSRELLAGVWDAERREAGRAAFAAVERPFAAAAWDASAGLLDEYTAAWAAARDDACAATRIRGEQSEELLDRRMACSRRQIDRVRSVVDALIAADAAVAERAVEVVSKLPEAAQCADIAALTSSVEQPPDPDAAEAAARLRQRQDAAYVTFQLGKQQEGADLTRAIVDDARALGLRPTLSEALGSYGQMRTLLGDGKAGEAALEESMLLAEASRHDHQVAHARVQLIGNLALSQNRFAEAHHYAKLAQAAIDRLGGDDRLQTDLLIRRVMLANLEADRTLSSELGAQALALGERAYGPDHLVVADIVNNMAINEKARGRMSEAERLYERALDIWTRRLGPEHPKLGTALTNLSFIHRERKQDAQAEQELRRALALYEQSLPPDHPEIAITLNALSQLMSGEDRHAEAEALALRALKIFEAKLGPRHRNVGAVHATIARVEVDLERFDAAVRHATLAVEIMTEVHGPDHPMTGKAIEALASVFENKKDLPRALAEYRRAQRISREHKDDSNLAVPLLGEARVLLEMGKATQALPILQATLELAEKQPDWDAGYLGTIRFPLARALWDTGQRPRALQLARAVEATWADDDRFDDSRARLATWLTTHQSP